MDDFKSKYDILRGEFDSYQVKAEMEIQTLSKRNMKLEQDMNVLTNIVEISKYINSYLSDENLVSMINDMVLGLLGVAYSTIFLEENGEFVIKATNVKERKVKLTTLERTYVKMGRNYIINDKDGIRTYDCEEFKICSAMAMPIIIREKLFGYILVEHQLYGFLNREHSKFLKSIASQIAIALENAMLYKELQNVAKKDPLLGIYNRRYFFEIVEKKAKENPHEPYAIVMLDLDNFKKFNDCYGHQFGDKVLIETNVAIAEELNSDEIQARYGGEEIVLYISDFDNKIDVFNKVDNLRKKIEQNIITNGVVSKTITASFGIGFFPQDGDEVSSVINAADNFLYSSKANGKNRVTYRDNNK